MPTLTLADKARARISYPGPTCDVTKALTAHPDLAEEIAELISDRTVSNKKAVDQFEDEGIDISLNVISRHRQNDCRTCRRNGRVW